MGEIQKKVTLVIVLCLIFSTLPLVKAAQDSWTTLEPMLTPRSDFGIALVNGKIYAIGGYLNGNALGINEMYDPATNTWTTKEPMPTARYGFGIAVYQNKIHVMGGANYGFLKAHEVYDPLTDTWEIKNGTDFGGFFCANVVNENLYVIGGWLQYLPPVLMRTQNMVYDPITDSWIGLESIPVGVGDYASAVIDDRIYVIGGRNYNLQPQNLTQIYDPETDTWYTGNPIPLALFSAAAGGTSGEFAQKRIYVVGGSTSDDMVNNVTYVYDPQSDTWTTATSLLTARYRLSVAVLDDKLFAIGGRKGDQYYMEYFNNNEMYTPFGYVPEFPSWTILPLILITTLVISLNRKRLKNNFTN
jgi:N-acetylneuraminic acid mutarotase